MLEKGLDFSPCTPSLEDKSKVTNREPFLNTFRIWKVYLGGRPTPTLPRKRDSPALVLTCLSPKRTGRVVVNPENGVGDGLRRAVNGQ